jgi:hypothetical protein
MNQATSSIVATSIVTTIEATNAIATTDNPTIVIAPINATIVLFTTIRNLRAASPTKKGWLQAQSLHQEKEWWGHAQWPVLFVEHGRLIWKKEPLLLKVSFALLFPVSLSLEQQEQQQSPCGSGWPQAERAPQARVFVLLQKGWLQTYPSPW